MPYIYWDSTYILVVIGAVICMIASARVKTVQQIFRIPQYVRNDGSTGGRADFARSRNL